MSDFKRSETAILNQHRTEVERFNAVCIEEFSRHKKMYKEAEEFPKLQAEIRIHLRRVAAALGLMDDEHERNL